MYVRSYKISDDNVVKKRQLSDQKVSSNLDLEDQAKANMEHFDKQDQDLAIESYPTESTQANEDLNKAQNNIYLSNKDQTNIESNTDATLEVQPTYHKAEARTSHIFNQKDRDRLRRSFNENDEPIINDANKEHLTVSEPNPLPVKQESVVLVINPVYNNDNLVGDQEISMKERDPSHDKEHDSVQHIDMVYPTIQEHIQEQFNNHDLKGNAVVKDLGSINLLKMDSSMLPNRDILSPLSTNSFEANESGLNNALLKTTEKKRSGFQRLKRFLRRDKVFIIGFLVLLSIATAVFIILRF